MAYQIPRGCQDVFGNESYKWQALEQTLRSFCYMYNYDEIRTPIFEHTEVFKRENDSSDMVNKEMYTFKLENSKTSLTLRPEGTAGVVRSFVENKMFANPDLPAKFYYMGPMSRHERPQKGRMRIFNQFGVEALGVKSPYVDVETIVLAFSILKSLGLNDIKVCLNTLGDDESRSNYRAALKEHFKDHLDDLCSDCKRRYEQNPLRILDCKVDKDNEYVKSAPVLQDYLNEESKQYFNEVLATLDILGIPYEIDNRLVRGLDYYTHTVFEVVSLHEDSGSQSTIFAGGRYDHLVEYFGGPNLSGMGFAIGLERLMMLIDAEGNDLNEDDGFDVYVMSLGNYQKEALDIATMLRAAGYKTDVNLQPRSMKAQFKSSDRKASKFVIIVGEDEVKNDQYVLKNQSTKEQISVSYEQIVNKLDELMEG